MSGVFGHRFGRRNSRIGAERSSLKYWLSSDLVLRHAKYVYDWLKPTFASLYINLGRVNASDRKITSACSRLTSRMSHSQNENGLVCGLSTRKIRTPCSTQKRTTPFSSIQSACHSGFSKSIG